MGRISFKKGGQKEFLDKVIENLNAPSLRGLLQFGLEVPYSTLKNYYAEARMLPQQLFNDLLTISRIEESSLDFEVFKDSWGTSKGGKKSKRGKALKH